MAREKEFELPTHPIEILQYLVVWLKRTDMLLTNVSNYNYRKTISFRYFLTFFPFPFSFSFLRKGSPKTNAAYIS
jgi:hypothetical protein